MQNLSGFDRKRAAANHGIFADANLQNKFKAIYVVMNQRLLTLATLPALKKSGPLPKFPIYKIYNDLYIYIIYI